MRYLLFIFSLCSVAYGQLLNEPFNNFNKAGLDSTVALYRFYSSPTTDFSNHGNANTLTAGGSIGDSITPGNAVLQKDSSVVFFESASTQYYYVPAASATNFQHGANDFTWEVLFHAADVNQHGYLLAKVLTSGAFTGTHIRIVNAAASGVGKRIVVQVRKDASNTRLLVSASDIVDGNPHHLALVRSGTTTIKLYVDGVEQTLNTLTSAGTDLTVSTTSNFSIGVWSDLSTLPFQGNIEYVRVTRRALTVPEVKEAAAMAFGWVSNSGNVARSNYGFNQGIVSDTIYYNTALQAGSWTITLSDSAASGVNYEVLTSADATIWATLASGTTGTSWGSKSYSGSGTGYVAVAVASGTAFFDDLVVSLNQTAGKKGFGKPFTTGFPKPFK